MKDKTEIIYGWKDLEKYGISFLTGESCAYSMRILCSLNEDGVQLLENFLSVKVDGRPWSGYKINGKETVASIMIPYGLFSDLATFCLFHIEKMDVVILTGSYIVGCSRDHYEEHAETYKEVYGKAIVKRNPINPTVSRNGRNVHQMSGRVE